MSCDARLFSLLTKAVDKWHPGLTVDQEFIDGMIRLGEEIQKLVKDNEKRKVVVD